MAKNEDLRGPEGWEARYRSGEIPWDLGEAPPILAQLLGKIVERDLDILVPGAGYGHDALAWAHAGHRATAVDIAPTAVAGVAARAREAGLDLDAIVADLFALPEDWRGRFDAVWEQTCFCAVNPDQRALYVDAMADVLKPGGMLYALLWNHGMEGGPPWSINESDVRTWFTTRFEVEHVDDVEQSAGERYHEFVVRMRRKD